MASLSYMIFKAQEQQEEEQHGSHKKHRQRQQQQQPQHHRLHQRQEEDDDGNDAIITVRRRVSAVPQAATPAVAAAASVEDLSPRSRSTTKTTGSHSSELYGVDFCAGGGDSSSSLQLPTAVSVSAVSDTTRSTEASNETIIRNKAIPPQPPPPSAVVTTTTTTILSTPAPETDTEPASTNVPLESPSANPTPTPTALSKTPSFHSSKRARDLFSSFRKKSIIRTSIPEQDNEDDLSLGSRGLLPRKEQWMSSGTLAPNVPQRRLTNGHLLPRKHQWFSYGTVAPEQPQAAQSISSENALPQQRKDLLQKEQRTSHGTLAPELPHQREAPMHSLSLSQSNIGNKEEEQDNRGNPEVSLHVQPQHVEFMDGAATEEFDHPQYQDEEEEEYKQQDVAMASLSSAPSYLQLPPKDHWMSYGEAPPEKPPQLRDIIHQSGLLSSIVVHPEEVIVVEKTKSVPQEQQYETTQPQDDNIDTNDQDHNEEEDENDSTNLPDIVKSILERPIENPVDLALKEALEEVLTMDTQEPIPCTCGDGNEQQPCLYHSPLAAPSSFLQPHSFYSAWEEPLETLQEEEQQQEEEAKLAAFPADGDRVVEQGENDAREEEDDEDYDAVVEERPLERGETGKMTMDTELRHSLLMVEDSTEADDDSEIPPLERRDVKFSFADTAALEEPPLERGETGMMTMDTEINHSLSNLEGDEEELPPERRDVRFSFSSEVDPAALKEPPLERGETGMMTMDTELRHSLVEDNLEGEEEELPQERRDVRFSFSSVDAAALKEPPLERGDTGMMTMDTDIRRSVLDDELEETALIVATEMRLSLLEDDAPEEASLGGGGQTGMMALDTDIRSTDEFDLLASTDGEDTDGSLGYSKSEHIALYHSSFESLASSRGSKSPRYVGGRTLSLIASVCDESFSNDHTSYEEGQSAHQDQSEGTEEQFPINDPNSRLGSFEPVPHYCTPQFEPQYLTPGQPPQEQEQQQQDVVVGLPAPPIDFQRYSPPSMQASLPSRSVIMKRPPMPERGANRKSPARLRPPAPLPGQKTALEEADEILHSEHVPSAIHRLDSLHSYQSMVSEITFQSEGDHQSLKIDPRAPQFQMAMEQEQKQQGAAAAKKDPDATMRVRNFPGGAAVAPPTRCLTPVNDELPHVHQTAQTVQPPSRYPTPPRPPMSSSDVSPNPPTRKKTPPKPPPSTINEVGESYDSSIAQPRNKVPAGMLPPTRHQTPPAPPTVAGTSPTPPVRKETIRSEQLGGNDECDNVACTGATGASPTPPTRKASPSVPPAKSGISPTPPTRKETPRAEAGRSSAMTPVNQEQKATIEMPEKGVPPLKMAGTSPTAPMRKESPPVPPIITGNSPTPPVRKETPRSSQLSSQHEPSSAEEDPNNVPLSHCIELSGSVGIPESNAPSAKMAIPPLRMATPPTMTEAGPMLPTRKETPPSSQLLHPHEAVYAGVDYNEIPLSQTSGRTGTMEGGASPAPPMRKSTPPVPPMMAGKSPAPPARKETPQASQVSDQSEHSDDAVVPFCLRHGSGSIGLAATAVAPKNVKKAPPGSHSSHQYETFYAEADDRDIPLSQTFGRKGTIGGAALDPPSSKLACVSAAPPMRKDTPISPTQATGTSPNPPMRKETPPTSQLSSRSESVSTEESYDLVPLPQSFGRKGSVGMAALNLLEPEKTILGSTPPVRKDTPPNPPMITGSSPNPPKRKETPSLSQLSSHVSSASYNEDHRDIPLSQGFGRKGTIGGPSLEQPVQQKPSLVEDDYMISPSVGHRPLLKLPSTPRKDSNPLMFPHTLGDSERSGATDRFVYHGSGNSDGESDDENDDDSDTEDEDAESDDEEDSDSEEDSDDADNDGYDTDSDEDGDSNRGDDDNDETSVSRESILGPFASPAGRPRTFNLRPESPRHDSNPLLYPMGLGFYPPSPKKLPPPPVRVASPAVVNEPAPKITSRRIPSLLLPLESSSSEEEEEPKRRARAKKRREQASLKPPPVPVSATQSSKSVPESNQGTAEVPQNGAEQAALKAPPPAPVSLNFYTPPPPPQKQVEQNFKPPPPAQFPAPAGSPEPAPGPKQAPAPVPTPIEKPARNDPRRYGATASMCSAIATIRVKLCPMEIQYVLDGQVHYHSGYYSGPLNAEGRMHGNGCFWFTTGDMYLGQFAEGELHGVGAMAIANENGKKEIFKGHFRSNEFVGEIAVDGSVC